MTTELRPELVQLAAAILAAQDSDRFIERAAEVGRALWADDEAALKALAEQYGCAQDSVISERIAAGTARRD